MEECEGKDTYVTQLKEVFDSCDTTGSGCLDKYELQNLCEKLHLTDHADQLKSHLFQNESEVKFENFKECFVAVLMQSIPSEEASEDSKEEEDAAEREVSPKFTLGRKKYGRRSRPASIADEDSLATSSVFSPETSIDQSSPRDNDFKEIGTENVQGKRCLSPASTQQPPIKSGRMAKDNCEVFMETCSSSQPTSDSDADLTQSFETNPVQYLQETWKKLNIGKNGYLNVEELALVCEHIGMDMSEEVVAQLFEKLDCDQDGQISFDEFLQGLFQHGDPQNCDSPFRKIGTFKSMYNDGSRDDHQISNTSISGLFSSIDPNNTGYADAATILEMWESLEVPCSPQLLEELGFNTNLKINLSDLSSVLEEVLCSVLSRPLQQLAFMTYQSELHFLRQTMDQMQSERNKLRVNIEEANSRAALLAQEVDDNHAKLENSLQRKLLLIEKKYQEQARELVEELQVERESLNAQTNILKQRLQEEVDAYREEESKLKIRFNSLEQENNRLEQELQEATEKCLETEKLNEALQKELVIMPSLKERLAHLESQLTMMQEQNPQNLLLELQSYKDTNQELQDKIDELTLEIGNMHQNPSADASSHSDVNRTHSWLSDYKKAAHFSGLKRRGSESSSDDNSDEENPSLGKLRKTLFSTGKQNGMLNPASCFVDFKKPSPEKMNSLGSLDVLLKDMVFDQSVLVKKLQVAEEKIMKTEKDLRQSQHKNKILSSLINSMSGKVFA